MTWVEDTESLMALTTVCPHCGRRTAIVDSRADGYFFLTQCEHCGEDIRKKTSSSS